MKDSEAIRTGPIEDLEETALMVEGIAFDKVSDIATTLIRQPLIAYTQAMCAMHKRRLPATKTRRSFLEPDMVIDLLQAAGEWETELPPHQRYGRRALIASRTLAGPRISELTEPPRADLDLAGRRVASERRLRQASARLS